MSSNDHSSADPFGQIADEFVEAFRQGKQPSVEEFARRYPAHADEIREMLPALVLMEKAKAEDDATGPVRHASATSAAPRIQQLGDYQILREVGRGGMGVVYEAQQLSLGRHVAIKVLPSHSLLDPRHLRRFEREARSAARLHHTNIVPVFGVGEQDGLHYYVMQFIQGLGLDVVLHELRRLRQPYGKWTPTRDDAPGRPTGATGDLSAVDVARSLLSGEFHPPRPAGDTTRTAAEPAAGAASEAPGPAGSADTSATIHLPGQTDGSTLTDSGSQYWQSVARIGVQVAEALAHAASQGVLHRDIKPSNLLLDETGNVWVTDFGLAKADADADNLTHTGDIVGTMRYMAPERFNGQGDLRSDLYSLGLTLYELLTLRPAFDEDDRNKLVKEVMHGEPVRPRKVNRSVPGDLETVVLKAIARDPSHRYQSPAEMAEDLKRFIEDRPIKARRVSDTERLWRWCRRNPLPAGLLAGIVVVFLLGFGGALWQWRAAVSAREDEKDQRDRAEVLRQHAELARDEAVSARDEAKHTRNAAARQAAGLLLDKGIEDANGGEPARALHVFVRALRTLPADDPEAAPLERVTRANLSAWAETVPALEHIWAGGHGSGAASFSPDGGVIAMAARPDEIQCLRTDTDQPFGPPIKVAALGMNPMMAFAPDSHSLWVGAPGRVPFIEPGAIHRFDPASGRPVQPPIPTAGPVMYLAVTPDGRHLVGTVGALHPDDRGGEADSGHTRRWRTASIVVWEAATGRVVRKVEVNAAHEYATADLWPDAYAGLSADGKSVTAWVERAANRFEEWNFTVEGNESPVRRELPDPGPGGPWKLHFRRDLRTGLVIKDDQLHRWSATNPGVLGPGIPTPFRSIAYCPSADGRSVISLTDGRVFDTGTWPPRPCGVRFAHPGWQRSPNACMEQSPDGRFTATWIWNAEGDGRLWRLPRPHSRPALPPAEVARQPQRANDLDNGQLSNRAMSAALWSYHASHLPGSVERTRVVRVVDLTNGSARVTSIRHSQLVRDVEFSADGRYFATASFDMTARVWETATGRPAGPPLAHTNYVAAVAFSPDGNTLAAGDYGPAGLVKFWDWRTGQEARPPLRHDDIILGVSFSPDGRFLAAIKSDDWSKNPEFLVWELASGVAVIRARNKGPYHGLRETPQFRPDGRAVATRDIKGVLRLWEVPSGKAAGERPLDGDGLTRFSPDGRVVAAAANLGVRLLDGNTLAPLPGGYLPHAESITDLAFSPDGAFLLTGCESGSARLWDVATRKPVGPPAVLVDSILGVTFTPDGKTCLCVAADGTFRRWPVPAPVTEPDLGRLSDRVVLMTGQRMDDNQGLDSVPADEWRALRSKLVGDGSTALAPPRSDADWHDAAAADAEQDRDSYGAEWHLDRLAALRPNDWIPPARRGHVLAAAGRTDEAAAAYDKAARLARSPRDLADWLRAAATEDEAAGSYDRALWNLDRAIKLTPEDWAPYAARATVLDEAGYADRAAADVDAAARLGAEATVIVQAVDRAAPRSSRPADWTRLATLLKSAAKDATLPIDDRYRLAVACLKAGDRTGYKAACTGIAGRLPPAGTPVPLNDAIGAAHTFTLGADATDDWAAPLARVERILKRIAERAAADPAYKEQSQTVRSVFLLAHGALLHRAGRFEEAAKVLREGLSIHPQGGEFGDWLFLALAEHRLGHADAAKETAAKARAVRAGSKPGSPWDKAEADLLAAELDAALPLPGK
jgi:serine/threonine protein kinase/WD40 repeat protein/tetratricopeptide (TPR) repeat protein